MAGMDRPGVFTGCQQPLQEVAAFVGAGESDRHSDRFFPVVQVCVVDQEVEIVSFDDRSRAEIVLERSVHEIDRTGCGLAQ
ncbi:hypothetical protein SANTM175S_07555 [Streptomyces antimycoticus]